MTEVNIVPIRGQNKNNHSIIYDNLLIQKDWTLTSIAKAKKKSAKEASGTSHNIMAASVKGNPALKKKAAK